MQAVVKIGDKLKRARIQNALTQQQLADKAGLTTASAARIERNETEPRPTTLRKLADALGVEPGDLLDD